MLFTLTIRAVTGGRVSVQKAGQIGVQFNTYDVHIRRHVSNVMEKKMAVSMRVRL